MIVMNLNDFDFFKDFMYYCDEAETQNLETNIINDSSIRECPNTNTKSV